MRTVSISEARDDFAALFNKVAFGHNRIVIKRRGKSGVAMVPIEDMEFMEWVEDQIDLQLIRERQDEPTVPWEKVRRRLGL